MTLSVIVTSCDTPVLLEQCLAALAPQHADEIIVADCSAEDPTARLRAACPRARVLHVARTSVPALRWTGAREARGDVIGAIEARCTPAPDWCDTIAAAHQAWPAAPAIGGPVDMKPGASAFDWGLYLCEYAAFAPPIDEPSVAQLSSANLSYKRADLLQADDLMDEGVWEAAIHERWRLEGRWLRLSPARVIFQNGMTPADALRMRFHYARAYVAERAASMPRGGGPSGPPIPRIVLACGAPLLPALLTWRTARASAAKGLSPRFVRALPWIVLLNTAWAAGELVGYLAGRPARPRIF